MVLKEFKEPQDLKETQVHKVLPDLKEHKDLQETKVLKEDKEI